MTTTTQQAVALREEKQSAINGYLQRLTPAIATVLPKHLSAERVTRIAYTLVRKDPKLADCAAESFAGALLTASALGLEPGVNGEAFLVPYNGECTLIIGYQGLAKLFWQHPMAAHLDAQAVHENDAFDYSYGLNPSLTHKPAVGDRGKKIVAYYAVASLTSGAKAFVVLTPEECKKLRGGKEGPSGKIPDPMHWMERKTALRQLFKLVPKSPMLARALAADDRPGSELRQELDRPLPAGALEAAPPAGVDPDTGVVEATVVEEPPSGDPWAGIDVAQPADA